MQYNIGYKHQCLSWNLSMTKKYIPAVWLTSPEESSARVAANTVIFRRTITNFANGFFKIIKYKIHKEAK